MCVIIFKFAFLEFIQGAKNDQSIVKLLQFDAASVSSLNTN